MDVSSLSTFSLLCIDAKTNLCGCLLVHSGREQEHAEHQSASYANAFCIKCNNPHPLRHVLASIGGLASYRQMIFQTLVSRQCRGAVVGRGAEQTKSKAPKPGTQGTSLSVRHSDVMVRRGTSRENCVISMQELRAVVGHWSTQYAGDCATLAELDLVEMFPNVNRQSIPPALIFFFEHHLQHA